MRHVPEHREKIDAWPVAAPPNCASELLIDVKKGAELSRIQKLGKGLYRLVFVPEGSNPRGMKFKRRDGGG